MARESLFETFLRFRNEDFLPKAAITVNIRKFSINSCCGGWNLVEHDKKMQTDIFWRIWWHSREYGIVAFHSEWLTGLWYVTSMVNVSRICIILWDTGGVAKTKCFIYPKIRRKSSVQAYRIMHWSNWYGFRNKKKTKQKCPNPIQLIPEVLILENSSEPI